MTEIKLKMFVSMKIIVRSILLIYLKLILVMCGMMFLILPIDFALDYVFLSEKSSDISLDGRFFYFPAFLYEILAGVVFLIVLVRELCRLARENPGRSIFYILWVGAVLSGISLLNSWYFGDDIMVSFTALSYIVLAVLIAILWRRHFGDWVVTKSRIILKK